MPSQTELDNAQKNLKIANQLKKQGQLDEALNHYQLVVKIEPENIPVLLHLAQIYETKEELDLAVECYQKVIKLRPENDKTYLRLAIIFKQQGRTNDLINAYQKAIELNPDQPLWVHQNLASALKQQSQQHHASASPINPNEEIYFNIWNALNQTNLDILKQTNSNYPTDIKQKVAQKFFTKTSNYKIIKLTSLSAEEQLFLEVNNISLTNLKLIQQDDVTQQESYLQNFGRELKIHPHRSAQNSDKVRFAIEFHQAMVETGYIYIICPITGKILSSDQSFLFVPGPALGIYRFVSDEVFYLIVGKASYEKQLIYFPKLELVIHLSARALNPEKVVNQLKGFVVSHWEKVLTYLQSNDQKKVVATLGFHTTPSHHLLNELSGIYRLYKMGMLNKVDKFLVGNHEYFGNLEQIFSEIPAEKIVRFSDTEKEKVSENILENNYFSLAIRDTFVAEELAKSIYQLSVKKCTSSFLATVKAAKKHFPLVLITVRTGSNRAWVSQVEGLANLIKQLSSEYPNLGIIFDGVSQVDKRNTLLSHQAAQEEAWMDRDREVVEQILALISDSQVNVYNAIGCMMYESIVWAYAADFYIAPFGGGLTKVTLIARKPGIVHTNHTVLKSQMRNYWYTDFQRENARVPIYVPGEDIVDIKASEIKQGARDSAMYDSYECDWKVIYDLAIKIISRFNRKVI